MKRYKTTAEKMDYIIVCVAIYIAIVYIVIKVLGISWN